MAAIWTLASAATFIKLLFMPAYRSTDFEVHRNWLAITHSLPIRQWYFEDTSEWTLDYPPLFAWFEWILSLFAQFFDKDMLAVANLNYASTETVTFQRISVIVTDFVYFYAVKEFQSYSLESQEKTPLTDFSAAVIPIQLIFNIGLFIVDHIHFQYNGLLFGIMLLSITRILQGKSIEGAFWFALLLNMKHIYIYIAPAFFIYLLRTHCFAADKPISLARFSVQNFISLAAVVGTVFMVSFGPFIYMGQLGQVLSRLFPFKRGLVHAYWAPNFWALYNAVDKVLTITGVKMGLISQDHIPKASMTGGMVQEYNHVVLPSIAPGVTMFIVAMGMLPALFTLWEKRTPCAFLRTVILCAFTSFLFGWHVHEKAVLMIIIPMTLLAMYNEVHAKLYLIIAIVGFYSLFPLMFTPFENMLKVLLLLQSSIFSFLCLGIAYSDEVTSGDDVQAKPSWLRITESNMKLAALKPFHLPLLNLCESLYILGLVPLGLFNSLGYWLLNLEERLPFLPLMLTSIYCALGIVYCYMEFYRLNFQASFAGSGDGRAKKKKL